MNTAGGSKRVGFLFTRYPVLSERFLIREIQELLNLGLRAQVYPTWFGEDKIPEAPRAAQGFRAIELLHVLWRIPYWAICRPRAMVRIAQSLSGPAPRSWLNLWENLLGMGYGLIRARKLAKSCDHLHAVWASAPATAAWTVHLLTGLPFSMSGHAYDLFENGGDWLIAHKLKYAAFIRTSTQCGYDRWLQLGADPARLHLIRRGLNHLPDHLEQQVPPHTRPPFRLLAVGRMVEKMGFEQLLLMAAALHRLHFPFHLTIIGDGPMRSRLEAQRRQLGLASQVSLPGAQPHEAVDVAYRQADCFLFTGKIASSGDRAGFPNVIGEAMAAGLPVCATPVGGVTEVIRHGETGIILDLRRNPASAVAQLLSDRDACQRIRTNAFSWVKQHFDVRKNQRLFYDLLIRSSD